MVPSRRPGRARPRVLIMGAGRGVGLACARSLAGSNADLLMSDIDDAALDAASREVGGAGLSCDVASEASVVAFAADVQRHFGAPDILINAAGTSYVRTLGSMRVTRAMLPLMKAQDWRTDVVNIAHRDGGSDGPFPYAGSIEAFACLADALADEVRGTNTVLTTIMPRPGGDGAGFDQALNAPRRRQFYCDINDHDAIAARVVRCLYPHRGPAGHAAPANCATTGLRKASAG